MLKTVLPKAFLKNLNQTFPPEMVDQIIDGFAAKRPTTFRINNLKTTIEEVEKELDKSNLRYRALDWPENTFIFEDDKKKLIGTDLYSNGLIYLQSLASLLPVILLDPRPNEFILDLTAAPGSKTTQIAALMKNTGKIIANDRHLIRLEKLKYNLKKQGVQNVEVTDVQGQDLWQKFPGKFDKTLLDAPCSLEGTFDTNYPKSFQNWSPDLVEALSRRQKDLIWSAYKATKPGGTIVYSTCTINALENEEVINWLLEKTGNQVSVEKITIDIPETFPGLTEWTNRKFHPSLKNTLRLLPSPVFEGFYLAKLTKIS